MLWRVQPQAVTVVWTCLDCEMPLRAVGFPRQVLLTFFSRGLADALAFLVHDAASCHVRPNRHPHRPLRPRPPMGPVFQLSYPDLPVRPDRHAVASSLWRWLSEQLL